MPKTLQLLIVEDNPADAELVLRELTRAGFAPQWSRVETEADYLAALKKAPDIILSDYSLPQFSGLRALELLQASGRDIPLILFSGTVGEDVAVEAMRLGAVDYLLKDRTVKLPSAVERALKEKQLR
ncbi:MAG TPA: response regulator, partial [Bryobacteraceae bacterium]|nr:response regulator [Bryobacteraceae bacterium]